MLYYSDNIVSMRRVDLRFTAGFILQTLLVRYYRGRTILEEKNVFCRQIRHCRGCALYEDTHVDISMSKAGVKPE